jgi:hypothetical protein
MPHEDHEAGQRKDGRSKPKHAPDHQRAAWRFLAVSACLRNSSAAYLVVRAISLRIALRSRAASAASRSALAFAERETDLRSSSSTFVGFSGGSGNTRPSAFQTSNAYTCRNEMGLRLFDSRISNARRIAALTVSARISVGNRMSRCSSYNNENWASRAPLRIRAGAHVSLCNWHASGSPLPAII